MSNSRTSKKTWFQGLYVNENTIENKYKIVLPLFGAPIKAQQFFTDFGLSYKKKSRILLGLRMLQGILNYRKPSICK